MASFLGTVEGGRMRVLLEDLFDIRRLRLNSQLCRPSILPQCSGACNLVDQVLQGFVPVHNEAEETPDRPQEVSVIARLSFARIFPRENQLDLAGYQLRGT